MNFWNKTKLFFSSLFQGFSNADDVIQGYSEDGDSKTIGVHQQKETKRVADALLKGEITQEVAELRYRDYLVSEKSRKFDNQEEIVNIEVDFKKSLPKIIALNHEISRGISDSIDDDGNVNLTNSHTLKFQYKNNVKFLLEKYCESFSIYDEKIVLTFNLLPNRNVITSKAFCNYLEKELQRKDFGGEYSRIDSMWFVSYKITSIPNYIKFTFNNLVLTEVNFDEKRGECNMVYTFNCYSAEDLTEKYVVKELQEKYANKEKKFIPQETEFINLNLKCEVCGSPMWNKAEGEMNKRICGKFCCTDCACKELMK